MKCARRRAIVLKSTAFPAFPGWVFHEFSKRGCAGGAPTQRISALQVVLVRRAELTVPELGADGKRFGAAGEHPAGGSGTQVLGAQLPMPARDPGDSVGV